jgi:plasmid stabilization system protein ParE
VIGYRFHRDARAEYRSAVAWYRERSLDAARGLVGAVAEGLRTIEETPLAWPLWRGGPVRRRVLRRFPYSLFYLESPEREQIVIVAVAHHSRSPGYWLSRLGR